MNGGVEGLLRKGERAHARAEIYGHTRKFRGVVGKMGHEPVRGERRQHRQIQSLASGWGGHDLVSGGTQLLQKRADLPEILSTDIRQHHPLSNAFEQSNSQAPLEFGDGTAHGPLRETQLHRGTREIRMLGGGREGRELIDPRQEMSLVAHGTELPLHDHCS
jgi:hypothetical protein